MTQGMNKVTLIGNLGADPELRYTEGGKAVLGLRLATTTTFGGGEGKPKREDTQWHNVSIWGNRGEALKNHLGKGDPVAIEGRISYRQWEDSTGAKREATNIVASDVFLLGSKGKDKGAAQKNWSEPQDDDIPF